MKIYFPEFRMLNCERCFGSGFVPVRGLHQIANIFRRLELNVRREDLDRHKWKSVSAREAITNRISELEIDLAPREKMCPRCKGAQQFEHVLDRNEHWVLVEKWTREDPDGIAFVEEQAQKNALLAPVNGIADPRILRAIYQSLHLPGNGSLLLPPDRNAIAPLLGMK